MRTDDTLTTGEAAKIANVSPRTVHMWCNRGLLPFFRLPTNSKKHNGDRRIKRNDLVKFLNNIGYKLEKGACLSVGCTVIGCLPLSPLQAAYRIGSGYVGIIIIDFSVGQSVAEELAEMASQHGVKIGAILNEDTIRESELFDIKVRRPQKISLSDFE